MSVKFMYFDEDMICTSQWWCILGKFFGKDETGAGLRAALLSGPPGIGKTTTATLVCKVR